MKYKLDKTVIFFLIVYIFWLAGGLIMAEIRDSIFSERILGFKVEYADIYNVLYSYVIFIIVFIFSAYLIARSNKEYSSKLLEIQLTIVFAFIAVLIKLSQYGFILFSGDYYSRFTVEANLLVNIFPTIFTVISVDFLHRNKNLETKSANKYLLLIIVISILSVLAGSRSTPFYALIAALSYYFIPFSGSENIKQYKLMSVKNVVFFLILIYIFGQFANILRWFSTDATFQDSLIAILGDSFPEYRSHSQASVSITDSKRESYSFILWLQNLSAYIFPGFVFEVFESSRKQVFNQIWTDFFQPIIWGDKEALYGIRTGLIGEINLALGDLYLIVFAAFFAYLLQKNKSKIITVTCLATTIPYGVTSIYTLFYCLLFQVAITKINKILPKKI